MADHTLPAAKKKKRIFRWVFLAVQLLFLIWVISGIAADDVDCNGLSAQACSDANAVGTGIGVALILVLWVIVDVVLGLTYLIFRKK